MKYFAPLLPLLCLAGCSSHVANFSIVSTKGVNLRSWAASKRGDSPVTGNAIAHIIVIFPIGKANISDAIDKALASVPGAVALVDAKVTYRTFALPPMPPSAYTQNAYLVEGVPLILTNKPAADKSTPETANHFVVRFDHVIEAFKATSLTPAEFKTLQGEMKPDRA